MPRGLDELKTALEEQAGSSDGSRELCDLLGLDVGGSAAARRQRLSALLDGPPSRRRLGWLDLLLRVRILILWLLSSARAIAVRTRLNRRAPPFVLDDSPPPSLQRRTNESQ